MPRGRNDYETAQIQGRLWTPAVLRPQMWMDASDLSTISADTNGVNTWRDKSGNLADFTQASNTLKPQLVVHKPSGNYSVSFDGVDDYLESSTGITSGTFSGTLTLFYAMTRTSAAQVGTLFQERIAANHKAFEWSFGPNYVGYGGQRVSTYSNTDTTMNFCGSTVYNLLAGSGGVVSQTYTPAAKDKLFVNGQDYSGNIGVYSIPSVPNIDGTAGSRIGGSVITQVNYPVGYFPGSACELVALTGAMSSRDRSLVEGYLGWKWNYRLVAGHPFANRPPLIGD